MVAEIAVGGETYPVACNAFTPIVFSREFAVERAEKIELNFAVI